MARYSSDEKRAYYIGQGFAMAMDGVRYDEVSRYMDDKMHGSFYAGHMAYDNLGRKFGLEKLAPSKKSRTKKSSAKKPVSRKNTIQRRKK